MIITLNTGDDRPVQSLSFKIQFEPLGSQGLSNPELGTPGKLEPLFEQEPEPPIPEEMQTGEF